MKVSKSWWTHAYKNSKNSMKVAGRAMNTPIGSSYGRWAAVGAGLGAIRGMADNIVGDDRVSVIGGAMQGAMMGAGARGIKSLWGARSGVMNKVMGSKTTSGGMGSWKDARSAYRERRASYSGIGSKGKPWGTLGR